MYFVWISFKIDMKLKGNILLDWRKYGETMRHGGRQLQNKTKIAIELHDDTVFVGLIFYDFLHGCLFLCL